MEIEKLSLGELISRCKIGQLWAVVVVIAGLIGGAFGLGYKTHSYINEAKINAIQLQIVRLTGELQAKRVERGEKDDIGAENTYNWYVNL